MNDFVTRRLQDLKTNLRRILSNRSLLIAHSLGTEMTSKIPQYLAKSACIGLSFLLFTTNSLLAHASETNFWSERRNSSAVHRSPSVARNDNKLAFLPLPITGPSPLFGRHPGEGRDDGFYSLPHQFGTIRNINPSPTNDEGRTTNDGRTIILIQDVHQNAEAQKNIGETIRHLVREKKIDLIALEGAFGPIDLIPFRSFPHAATRNIVADLLLKENKIGGPLHAALTLPQSIPPIVGVDDLDHYEANVEAYRQSSKLKDQNSKKIKSHKLEIQKEKERVFGEELLEFDEMVEGYRKGNITLGDYVRRTWYELRSTRNSLINNSLYHVPRTTYNVQINLFMEALNLESSLNFDLVEHERSRLISHLVKKLNQSQVAGLMSQTNAYRSGEIRHTDFYAFLKNLCQVAGVDLKNYRNMDDYIQYVLLSDGIKPEKLFKELNALEKVIYDRLAKTDEETALISESKRLHLTGKLLDFALTPEEWGDYKSLPISSPFMGEDKGGGINSPHPALPSMRGGILSLSSFEAFYKFAQTRDEAMSRNLLAAMVQHNAKTAVLVTGGFHTKGIEAEIQSRAWCIVHGASISKHDARCTMYDAPSIISFVPKITEVKTESGSNYLSIFTQEKAPLEKLFEGQKLFLAQPAWLKYTNFITKLLFIAQGALSIKPLKNIVVNTNQLIIDANLFRIGVNHDGERITSLPYLAAVLTTRIFILSVILALPLTLFIETGSELISQAITAGFLAAMLIELHSDQWNKLMLAVKRLRDTFTPRWRWAPVEGLWQENDEEKTASSYFMNGTPDGGPQPSSVVTYNLLTTIKDAIGGELAGSEDRIKGIDNIDPSLEVEIKTQAYTPAVLVTPYDELIIAISDTFRNALAEPENANVDISVNIAVSDSGPMMVMNVKNNNPIDYEALRTQVKKDIIDGHVYFLPDQNRFQIDSDESIMLFGATVKIYPKAHPITSYNEFSNILADNGGEYELPFIRGLSRGKNDVVSFGRGLYSVRNIARHHGGDYRYQTHPSFGTIFTLTLRATSPLQEKPPGKIGTNVQAAQIHQAFQKRMPEEIGDAFTVQVAQGWVDVAAESPPPSRFR